SGHLGRANRYDGLTGRLQRIGYRHPIRRSNGFQVNNRISISYTHHHVGEVDRYTVSVNRIKKNPAIAQSLTKILKKKFISTWRTAGISQSVYTVQHETARPFQKSPFGFVFMEVNLPPHQKLSFYGIEYRLLAF